MTNALNSKALSDLNEHRQVADKHCLRSLILSKFQSKIEDVRVGFAEACKAGLDKTVAKTIQL
jgi:hypothetical protein